MNADALIDALFAYGEECASPEGPSITTIRNKNIAVKRVTELCDQKTQPLVTLDKLLLDELENAHLIIRNALNIMTVPQKRQWAEHNALDNIDGEGATRANERAATIALAKGEHP